MFESTTVIMLLALLCVIVLLILSISTMVFIKTFRNKTSEDLNELRGAVDQISHQVNGSNTEKAIIEVVSPKETVEEQSSVGSWVKYNENPIQDESQNNIRESRNINKVEDFFSETEKGTAIKQTTNRDQEFLNVDISREMEKPYGFDKSQSSSFDILTGLKKDDTIALENNPEAFWKNLERRHDTVLKENYVSSSPQNSNMKSASMENSISQGYSIPSYHHGKDPVTLDQALAQTGMGNEINKNKLQYSNPATKEASVMGEVDELERQLKQATARMQAMAADAIGNDSVEDLNIAAESKQMGTLQSGPRIFTDRDNNVDKLGRVYSVEELKGQIR